MWIPQYEYAEETGMSEQQDRKSDEEGFQDIYLEDILNGVGTFLLMASEFVEILGAGGAPPFNPDSASQSGARTPLIDVFDEGLEIVLALELPGASADRVAVEVQDDILSLEINGERPYRTEILLPRIVDPASLSQAFRNGILEIRLA
jgi:HSP20 family molecular chaperone IbpA